MVKQPGRIPKGKVDHFSRAWYDGDLGFNPSSNKTHGDISNQGTGCGQGMQVPKRKHQGQDFQLKGLEGIAVMTDRPG